MTGRWELANTYGKLRAYGALTSLCRPTPGAADVNRNPKQVLSDGGEGPARPSYTRRSSGRFRRQPVCRMTAPWDSRAAAFGRGRTATKFYRTAGISFKADGQAKSRVSLCQRPLFVIRLSTRTAASKFVTVSFGSGAASPSVITGACSAIILVHCNTVARHQRREPDAPFISAMQTAPACAYGR